MFTKRIFSKVLALAFAFCIFTLQAQQAQKVSSIDFEKVAVSVARLLEQGHYSRQKLQNVLSKKILDGYLSELDPSRMYFTQQDIDEFQNKYSTQLDNAILSGDQKPAQEIFACFKKRVEERVAKNQLVDQKKMKLNTDGVVELSRKDSPWPKDEAEADKLWQARIQAEYVEEALNEHPVDPPKKVIARRQEKVLRNVREMSDEEVITLFLKSVAAAYDPHSEYLSPSELENFYIQMKTALVGVGAVLQSEDGYAKIKEIVPGGPAAKEGRLKVNDRITAVAQADGEFEDVVDMKLDKVVEKIRGKKGTIVRLQVIPADSTDASKRKIIAIRRDEVQLKDQQAKADVFQMTRENDEKLNLGWITLPSFYADIEQRSVKNARSTTEDVTVLLERLKKEKIQGLVIDLRNNGGGSLEEAIRMTGLFIPKGPVVQAKDANGNVTVSQDDHEGVAWSGPLIVLMNRLSASASEIFAAALQDYGRAVVVGDQQSFGKGTVQTMLEIGRFMPFFSQNTEGAGALKLTINKFYRVKGGATQLEGVKSDVVLPSLTDNAKIGEKALTGPLPYDEVARLNIERFQDLAPILPLLRAQSDARVVKDPEFVYIQEDIGQMRKRLEENKLSLNINLRKAEIAKDKAQKEQRAQERKKRGPALHITDYELTLDHVNSAELPKVAFDRKRDNLFAENLGTSDTENEEIIPDAIRNETLRILADLVELQNKPVTAAVP